jgi:methionyl aminopeptidase
MLKTILSISGKPGLYKLVSHGKNMLIVESLTDNKRVPAYAKDKVISLGDSAYTFGVGEINSNVKHLLKVTKQALLEGIDNAVVGKRIGDIGFAIQNLCENSGYGVVREFVGHGIGRNMHEDPQVPNYGRKGYGPLLKTGMCIAIEPMITLGSRLIIMERDGWTVRTKDCSYSAHFEHTVAITNKEADVLSTFDYIDEVLRI